jgi:hypothetical protein
VRDTNVLLSFHLVVRPGGSLTFRWVNFTLNGTRHRKSCIPVQAPVPLGIEAASVISAA